MLQVPTGTSRNKPDMEGRSCKSDGQVNVTEAIPVHGADPDAKDKGVYTPLRGQQIRSGRRSRGTPCTWRKSQWREHLGRAAPALHHRRLHRSLGPHLPRLDQCHEGDPCPLLSPGQSLLQTSPVTQDSRVPKAGPRTTNNTTCHYGIRVTLAQKPTVEFTIDIKNPR